MELSEGNVGRTTIEGCRLNAGSSPLRIDSSLRTYLRYTFSFGQLNIKARMKAGSSTRLDILSVTDGDHTRTFEPADLDLEKQRYIRNQMFLDGLTEAYYLDEQGTFKFLNDPDDDRIPR